MSSHLVGSEPSPHPHHLPRHQRMDPVRRAEPPDFGHHRLALARLDVRDSGFGPVSPV